VAAVQFADLLATIKLRSQSKGSSKVHAKVYEDAVECEKLRAGLPKKLLMSKVTNIRLSLAIARNESIISIANHQGLLDAYGWKILAMNACDAM
jgi:hypothetical protein